MDNLDVIVKGAFTDADLHTAGAGYLNPEQSSKFIQGIIDQPTIINAARTVQITGESRKIEKIGFGSRIMRAAAEGIALTADQYAKPDVGKVELNTKEVIAEVHLTYDTIEANIEQAGLRNTIIGTIQQRAALDLEELIMQGDTTSSDTYLKTLDGVIKKVNTHVVNAKATEIDLPGWSDLIRAVPNKYLRNVADWNMYTSRNIDMAWKERIASRNTVAGDRFLLQNGNASALGFNVQPIAMMPENLSYDADGEGAGAPVTGLGLALLTNPQNLVIGFTRKVQIELDKNISSREYIIVCTMKMDVAIEEVDAAAKLINLKTTYTAS